MQFSGLLHVISEDSFVLHVPKGNNINTVCGVSNVATRVRTGSVTCKKCYQLCFESIVKLSDWALLLDNFISYTERVVSVQMLQQ